MKLRVYIVLIAFAFILGSCELSKEIDYETTYDPPKLIVHGFISINDGVQVIVKKTVEPDKINNDDKVADAVVHLYKNDTEFIKLKKENDYLYVTDSLNFISYGDNYQVRVEASGFRQVSSNFQILPNPPVIDSVKLLIDVTYFSNLIVNFDNNYSEKESFYITVIYYLDGKIEETMTTYEKFNPYSMLKHIKPQSNSVEYQTGHASYFDSLKVELYVLSEDLSRFLISQQNYEYSKEDPFYAQTYPVYSNIAGGYGIFASYSYNSIIIRKPIENESNENN
jgi:hypothetical protein